ncbi:MAG: hypothetical protein WAZ48_04175 [Lysobacteraceae bacterium]
MAHAAELRVILGEEAHYDPEDVELWELTLSCGGILNLPPKNGRQDAMLSSPLEVPMQPVTRRRNAARVAIRQDTCRDPYA